MKNTFTITNSNIKQGVKRISDKEKEDIWLLKMMMKTDRTELVAREEVMKKLRK